MLLLTGALLTWTIQFGYAFPTSQKQVVLPNHPGEGISGPGIASGDLHPDPFYKYHSSSEEDGACHRGNGPAGIYGAETTDCDSPISLINATFKWIDENLKDKIDFVIWTGDSARHDNDEEIPRSVEQVANLNKMVVNKFVEVFGKEDKINDTDPTNDFIIPIVPTWGNNDILPHNIFPAGPNKWTRTYLDIWRKFIPEEQRHGFATGGWFFVEVIPNRLAVLSLNTIYFFDSNSAVDGCAARSEPGYQHMEWLRIQLHFLRQRGMKAILMGHVPPARTESKKSWDETCWQKYTLWMHQFRDVVVGSLYGHMNIDHFTLQDSEDVKILALHESSVDATRSTLDKELTVQSASDYLTELRTEWSRLPDTTKLKQLRSKAASQEATSHAYSGNEREDILRRVKRKEKKYLKKIGGPWGERYSLSLVSPSIVPNYFPTLRVIEYNISSFDTVSIHPTQVAEDPEFEDEDVYGNDEAKDCEPGLGNGYECLSTGTERSSSRSRPEQLKLKIPKGPSKSSPPGPAYSPQTFSWTGYTQYFANLTNINNDFTVDTDEDTLAPYGWKEGKHHGKHPKHHLRPNPKQFKFDVEYDTRNDTVFGLEDLTVKSYLKLAGRIGQYRPKAGDKMLSEELGIGHGSNVEEETDLRSRVKHKKGKKKHGKHGKRKVINKVWFAFVRRAFIGTRDDEELHDVFG
ncbi:Endopolyphosphatase [Trapelia coarctata]|nr:Endopolyphosphatase [Trapelia coarctata]